MATRERTEVDTICDRPGCGRKVTDKGGCMMTLKHRFESVTPGVDVVDHVDLCRECLGQMKSAWNRKADGE